MKRALQTLVILVVGALIGVIGTIGVEHLRDDDEVLRGVQYGGSSAQEAKVGKPYTFDGGSVCVTGGFGRITGVRPRHAQGGLVVTGFRLVDDIMTNRRTDVVTTRCRDDSDAGQRLFVTVKADRLPAAADGYVIDYKIDGRTAHTTSRNWALLCDPKQRERGGAYGDIIPKCWE